MEYYIYTKVRTFGKGDNDRYTSRRIKETENYVEVDVKHDTSFNGSKKYTVRIPWHTIDRIEVYEK